MSASAASLLLVSVGADLPGEISALLAELDDVGITVYWGHLEPVAQGHSPVRKHHRLQASENKSRLQPLVGTAGRFGGVRWRMSTAARFDPWFARAVRAADTVIGLDDGAEAALRHVAAFAPEVPIAGPDRAAVAASSMVLQRRVDDAVTALTDPTPEVDLDEPLSEAERWLSALPVDSTLAERRRLLIHLVATRRLDAADRLLVDVDDAVIWGCRALISLTKTGTTDHHPTRTAAALLRTFENAPIGSDDAAAALTVALDLTFHRELHSDVEQSPLVEEPSTYLAPLRAAALWRHITEARTAIAPGADLATGDASRALRVRLLPGPYGNFYLPVLEALRNRPEVDVEEVDLRREHPTFRYMTTDPLLVHARADARSADEPAAVAAYRAHLQDADVVFADWADKAAMVASLVLPPGARLVIRVHSVDALRPWVHLVDWSRVSDLVSVAPHIDALLVDLLGSAIDGVQRHVIPNVIDLDRFAGPKPTSARLELGMVGWGRRVKDPLWAVDVLSELLSDGQDWHLTFLGADFTVEQPVSGVEYAETFRRRILADDVRERIRFTGFTRHLPEHLRGIGFVLSGSVREGMPVGVVEAMAAGAVPVIRDWPTFSSRGGAHGLFGDAVVPTIEEAVARIRAASADWGSESDAARLAARSLAPRTAADDLIEVITGRHPE